jgi:hypothetical protein
MDSLAPELQQPTTPQPPVTPTKKLNIPLLIGALLLIVIVGVGGFFLGKQTTNTVTQQDKQEVNSSPNTDNSFLKRIEQVYSFNDSQGNVKKIVILNKNPDLGNEVYLTNDSLNFLEGIKIWERTLPNTRWMIHFPRNQENKSKFVLEISFAGEDIPHLVLFNDEGKIVNNDLLNFNPGDIAYRDLRKTQPNGGGTVGVQTRGFNPNSISDTNTFSVVINNALGEEFPVDIDLSTGKYTERKAITASPTP